jgi:hypothetical protein
MHSARTPSLPSSFAALALTALWNAACSGEMTSLFRGVKKVVHARRTAGPHCNQNETGSETILEVNESESEEISASDGTRGPIRVQKKKNHKVKTFVPPLVEGAHHEVRHGGLNGDFYNHNPNGPSQGQAQPTGQQSQGWYPSHTQPMVPGCQQAQYGSPTQPQSGLTISYGTQGSSYGSPNQDPAMSSGGQQMQYSSTNQQQSGQPWQNNNPYDSQNYVQSPGNDACHQWSSSPVQEQSYGVRPPAQPSYSSPEPSNGTQPGQWNGAYPNSNVASTQAGPYRSDEMYSGIDNTDPFGFPQPGGLQKGASTTFHVPQNYDSRPDFPFGSGNLGRASTMPVSMDSWRGNGYNATR